MNSMPLSKKVTSQSEQWQAQIAYSDSDEAVSTDFVGWLKRRRFGTPNLRLSREPCGDVLMV